MTEPNRLSAAEAVVQLASGALTAEELTRACLDRAAARASVKAWIWLDPEQALAQARAAGRAGRPRPPWPALGPADRDQGHHRHRRHADRARLADLSRQPAVCRRGVRRAAAHG